MDDLISRQDALLELEKWEAEMDWDEWCYEHKDESQYHITAPTHVIRDLSSAQEKGYIKIPETGIDDVSDGYHTFRQLYYQRMMLFATIVKQNKEKAWKSLRHEDGELCFGGGWFIVGIDTPEGSYTYHYEDNFYSMFDCEELERARHWDGHTEKDITRLLSLPSAQPENFEWCHDCKEYDKEQHCCHRWSQQIRKTIEELEASYPQEAKDELLYWKERAAKWERDYYIRIKKGEPERKKGRWIKNSTHINCSVCKHCSWSLSFEDTVRQFNFCPNCGSLNGGEEE